MVIFFFKFFNISKADLVKNIINQSISNSQQKSDTLKSRQFTNLSFIDENLTDEDAWMPILDIVNAEV